jgi:hypothetical protein
MEQKLRVNLSQLAYRALELEGIARGLSLKEIASDMILKSLSPRAQAMWKALDPNEYKEFLSQRGPITVEPDNRPEKKIIETSRIPERVSPEEAWSRETDGYSGGIGSATSEVVHQALEYILEQFNLGQDPGSAEIAAVVGCHPRPLGIALSRLGLTTIVRKKDKKPMRVFSKDQKAIVESILKEKVVS